MGAGTIDRRTQNTLQTFAQGAGIVSGDEKVEVYRPTLEQSFEAARKRDDAESLYDAYVVKKPGEAKGTLVNVVRHGKGAAYLNTMAAVSKIIGIIPVIGPIYQAMFAATYGVMAGVLKLFADNDVDAHAQAAASARFAASQLLGAAVGFGEDALLTPLGSAIVRAIHNGPAALQDAREAKADLDSESEHLHSDRSTVSLEVVSTVPNASEIKLGLVVHERDLAG